jgi:hypothetical protein
MANGGDFKMTVAGTNNYGNNKGYAYLGLHAGYDIRSHFELNLCYNYLKNAYASTAQTGKVRNLSYVGIGVSYVFHK